MKFEAWFEKGRASTRKKQRVLLDVKRRNVAFYVEKNARILNAATSELFSRSWRLSGL